MTLLLIASVLNCMVAILCLVVVLINCRTIRLMEQIHNSLATQHRLLQEERK